MDAVLLDTDVFSYLMRRNDPRAALYRPHVQDKTVAISFVTVGELYAGALRKQWSSPKLADLEARIKAAVIVPYDLEICKTYGRLRNELKTATGSDRVIGPNDLWIASCAIRHGIPLVTNNRKHFDGIAGLEILTEAPIPKAQPAPETKSLFDKPETNGRTK